MSNEEFRFRHVWRDISDGNRDVKVLALQIWIPAEGWEHEDIIANGGYWHDVEVSIAEPDDNPAYTEGNS